DRRLQLTNEPVLSLQQHRVPGLNQREPGTNLIRHGLTRSRVLGGLVDQLIPIGHRGIQRLQPTHNLGNFGRDNADGSSSVYEPDAPRTGGPVVQAATERLLLHRAPPTPSIRRRRKSANAPRGVPASSSAASSASRTPMRTYWRTRAAKSLAPGSASIFLATRRLSSSRAARSSWRSANVVIGVSFRVQLGGNRQRGWDH